MALKIVKDESAYARTFGFNHDPSTCYHLLNSTAEPPLQTTEQGILASKAELNEYESYLKFPNIHMDRCYLLYEKFKSSPVDKVKYNENVDKMKELLQLIKSSEDNIVEWFKWITVAENEKFIRLNVEYRLSKDMSNKQLWKLYIQFLKVNNRKEMYLIYSKYCKFFDDDKKMLMEYWNAKKWNSCISTDFEKKCLIQPNQPQIKCEIFFTPENATTQSWSFRSPFIKYIIENANGNILSKLQQSCKYFYIKRPILPCYRIVLGGRRLNFSNGEKCKYEENSVHYPSAVYPASNNKNMLISTSLYASSDDERLLSKFINERFYKCDAKHIEIRNQTLRKGEFEFLVGHGNVETCCVKDVMVFKQPGIMKVDDILTKMPKLQYFSSDTMPLTNEVIEKLSHFSFQNKILCCNFLTVDQINFTPEAFCAFIVKNASPYSTCGIRFRSFVATPDVDDFRVNVNQFFHDKWNLEQEKPKIIISQERPHF
jgi:hypothetical protein